MEIWKYHKESRNGGFSPGNIYSLNKERKINLINGTVPKKRIDFSMIVVHKEIEIKNQSRHLGKEWQRKIDFYIQSQFSGTQSNHRKV